MNSYEAKQEARKQRYQARAEKAATLSNGLHLKARAAVEHIPLGQPILVDHYSASRHRGALRRHDQAMRASCEAAEKAKHYERKAESVGCGGISSDDPDAISKLETELSKIQEAQQMMVAVNKTIRKHQEPERRLSALMEMGFAEDRARDILQPDFAGRVGFARYALSNNSANASRIRKRIDSLKATKAREAVQIDGNGYRYTEDTEDNRVRFEFDGKPAEDIRALLKSRGFKWSPSRGAWVRHLNNAGIYAAETVRKYLDQP